MKFREERYITPKKYKNGMYSFMVRVRINGSDIVKTFKEKDYPSVKAAFEAAVHFRDKTVYEATIGIAVKKNNTTVQNLFDSYIDTTTSSFETKRKHKILFKKYITHKGKRIQELTRADIIEDLNRMVDVASDDTISLVLTIYRNDIIMTALSKELIFRDVSMGIKKPESHLIMTHRTHETDKETVEKVKKLLISTMKCPYNARIACFLLDVLYYTGMRPGEAMALNKSDIRDGYIFVTKEVGSSRDDSVSIRRCKTRDSVRSIPIHPELKPILDDLMEYAEEEALFLKWDGHYMSSDWLSNIIARLCKKNGIKFNMYRLRHNLATQLVTNNVDQKTTIELLGHSNYDMSLYYASSNNELKEDAINLVS